MTIENHMTTTFESSRSSNLSCPLNVVSVNTMDGQVHIVPPVRNTMKISYQVLPDLPSYMMVSPSNTMDGRVEILPPPRITVPLTSIKDAFVRSTRPTLNYGGASSLEMGLDVFDGGVYRSFVAFDISYLDTILPGEELISAKIRLYLTGDRNADQEIVVYEVAKDWEEHGITWLNQPGPVGDPVATIVVTPNQKVIEWDVTDYIIDLWGRGETTHPGFLIQSQDEAFPQIVRAYSKDHTSASQRPALLIEHTLLVQMDYTQLKSSISVQLRDESELTSSLSVVGGWAEDDVTAWMRVARGDTLFSDIEVTRPSLHSRISVRRSTHEELTSSLQVQGSAGLDLTSRVYMSRPVLKSSVQPMIHSQIDADMIVRQHDWEDLHSDIGVSRPDVPGSMFVLEREDLASTLTVKQGETKDLKSFFKVSRPYMLAWVIPSINDDINASLYVRGQDFEDLVSTLNVSRKDIEGSLAIFDREDLYGETTVRRHESEDLVSELQVGGGNLRASIYVVIFRDEDDLPSWLIPRVFDISELTSWVEVQYHDSDFKATLHVRGNEKYAPEGKRTLPPLPLDRVRVAKSSMAIWEAVTPPGTSVTIEFSLDGGATWLDATNGEAIPGLPLGVSLEGKVLLVRQTLRTDNVELTPVLKSFELHIETAYATNKITFDNKGRIWVGSLMKDALKTQFRKEGNKIALAVDGDIIEEGKKDGGGDVTL